MTNKEYHKVIDDLKAEAKNLYKEMSSYVIKAKYTRHKLDVVNGLILKYTRGEKPNEQD